MKSTMTHSWTDPKEESEIVNESPMILSPVDKSSKIIFVQCPGKKIAIRSVPNVKSSVVIGYIRNGDVIEVYRETIGGFFKLIDKKVLNQIKIIYWLSLLMLCFFY